MEVFVLILTLIIDGSYNTDVSKGGVAMQEFKTETTCNSAGIKWVAEVHSTKSSDRAYRSDSFYICAKKSD